MKITTSKEIILKRIREGLIQKTTQPFPEVEGHPAVYRDNEEMHEVLFAEQLKKVQGQFMFCENISEVAEGLQALIKEKQWKEVAFAEPALKDHFADQPNLYFMPHEDLHTVNAGLTFCEALIARTGSILMSSRVSGGRKMPIYPPAHIVLAFSEQMIYDIKEGLQLVKQRYGGKMPSLTYLETGPSRTADIEKTLVLGIHGPQELYVFLCDQPLS